jgi:hypothetical protein
MEEYQKPMDCRHYPSCEDLKAVTRDIPASFSGTHALVLQREAEPICDTCHDFERKDMAGAA